MRLVALKDFTLGGETHAKGEVFEADQMRGEAWIVAKVARRANPGEEVVTQPIAPPPEAEPKEETPEAETLPASDDPKVRRVIEDDNED